MSDSTLTPGLWAPRSVEDTLQIYADWADTYDADLIASGYATPDRVARLLASYLRDLNTPVLDFGCGTGLSGQALAAQGVACVDGTDISDEMRAQAVQKNVYRRVFASTPDAMPSVTPGDYGAITAVGVISLGAGPASLLAPLLSLLAPGGLLAFSFNEATLVDADYQTALAEVQSNGAALLLAAEHGPHIPDKPGAQTSTVYLLQRL